MYLCIDTVSIASAVTLVHKKQVVGFEPLESRHSSDGLFMAIDRLFKDKKVLLSDLQGIAVVKGPGSFTSVRVGVSVANQFSHQLKIPIVGLTTDQWYRFKTNQNDFVYLQTMNRDELYAVGFGKWETKIKIPIIPISGLPSVNGILWLGQLSPEHRADLPKGFEEIRDAKNTQDTWVSACESVFKSAHQKAYELVEPYYGKEPHITLSKRHLKIGKIQ